MDTEAQQVTIDFIIDRIRLAIVALNDRKEELESQEYTEENNTNLKVISLRLDLLIKIELSLLAPIKELYAFISRGSEVIQPEDLNIMLSDTEKTFIKKILQGL